MVKLAYAVGVSYALKQAGLIKTALTDDVSMNATPANGLIEQMIQRLEQDPDGIKIPMKQGPDNATKVKGKQPAQEVHWGPKVSPDGTNTFSKYVSGVGSNSSYPT